MIKNPIYDTKEFDKPIAAIARRFYLLVDIDIEPILINSLSSYNELENVKEKNLVYDIAISHYFERSKDPITIMNIKDIDTLIEERKSSNDIFICALIHDDNLIIKLNENYIHSVPIEVIKT